MNEIMDAKFERRKQHIEEIRREVERNRLGCSLETAGKEDTGSIWAAAGWELRRYGGRLLKLLRVGGRRPKTRRSLAGGSKTVDTDEPARDRRGPKSASSRVRRLLPLVLSTMASQALLVVLAPTIVEAGRAFGASVGADRPGPAAVLGGALGSLVLIAPLLGRLRVPPLAFWG